MIGDLRNSKAFAQVVDGLVSRAWGRHVAVSGKIIAMRVASSAARFFGGAMAGSSYMDVYVKISDASSGKMLQEKIIATHNNPFGAAWSGGSSDKSMPVDMGQIISQYLVTVVTCQ